VKLEEVFQEGEKMEFRNRIEKCAWKEDDKRMQDELDEINSNQY
jgi:hypothetical protein